MGRPSAEGGCIRVPTVGGYCEEMHFSLGWATAGGTFCCCVEKKNGCGTITGPVEMHHGTM